MPIDFKHILTQKEKILARWSVGHVLAAVIVGAVLACGLIFGQAWMDSNRIVELKQTAAPSNAKPDQLPPDSAPIGGPFQLVNQDGKTVTDKDFAGKYLLVYFGYTSCPDMCPTGLQSISRAMDLLKSDADKVQPLFITVDPPRDTPARLKQYDAAFHPKIVGLTGTAEQIAAVAKEYQVYYEKGEGEDDYEIEHSSVIYLMNTQGKLVRTFDEEVDPAVIVDSLHKELGVAMAPVPSPTAAPKPSP